MDSIYVVIFAITQIPVMFILMSRRTIELLTIQCYKRNPNWLATHQDFQVYETLGRLTRWISYLLAVGTLAFIIYFVHISPTPGYYVPLLFYPQWMWLVLLLTYMVVIYKGVMKKIPMQSRKASLIPRRLSSYVPPWIVYLGFGLNALVLGIYIWALILGAIGHEVAIRRLIGIGVFVVGISVLLLVALRRKRSNAEVIFGPSGRKVEVWFHVAVIYLMPFVGFYRILCDFFGVLLFSHVASIVIISLLTQATFILFSFHPKTRAVAREYRERLVRKTIA